MNIIENINNEEIISDEVEQRRALSRQMYYMDMTSARKEGEEEGKKEGEKKSKIEMAKKMKEDKMSIELIMKYTGLTENEINEL